MLEKQIRKAILEAKDNKEKLLRRILSNKGDKYAALEVVGDGLLSNDDSAEKPHRNYYDAKEVNKLIIMTF